MEPRFGALALRISDWPETPTVCSTPGVRRAILFDAGHEALRALDRGSIRQLHVEDHVSFVLIGNEPGGHRGQLPAG